MDAIKEAYRDLLSTNDKAFEKEKSGGGGGGGSKESKRGSSSESIFEGGMSYSFSGRLSLGVDKITNSIIVSAEGEDLLKLVIEMISRSWIHQPEARDVFQCCASELIEIQPCGARSRLTQVWLLKQKESMSERAGQALSPRIGAFALRHARAAARAVPPGC